MPATTPSERAAGRLEAILGGLFLASAVLAVLHQLRVVVLTGLLPLTLQGLYTFAAAAGWVSGNLFVRRRRLFPGLLRRRFLVLYLLGPFGLYACLWSLGPKSLQEISPLVPLYALGVSSTLFLVPYLLRRWPGP